MIQQGNKTRKAMHTFKKILLFGAGAALVLTACVTERKRQRICASCPVKSSKERSDCTVVRTQTVPVLIPAAPGPTVYLPNPCATLCDSLGRLREGATINTVQDGTTVHLTAKDGSLQASISTPQQTAVATVTNTERHTKEATLETRTLPCDNERTDFDGFCRWWFYITAGGFAIWQGFKYLRRRFWPP